MQALAVVLALLALAPFLWLLLMSFKTNAEIFRFPPRLLFDATFANYAPCGPRSSATPSATAWW